jgi:hypothetical protein
MKIFIHFLNGMIKQIEWNEPFLPRVGEHLSVKDFIPESNIEDDFVEISDIHWFKLGDEICVSLFAIREDINDEEREKNRYDSQKRQQSN